MTSERSLILARGLPELKGSLRQIEWAEQIRAQKWGEFEAIAIELGKQGEDAELSELLQCVKWLRLKREARFWIAHRDTSVFGLLELGRGVV